jgi:hypothetical protein
MNCSDQRPGDQMNMDFEERFLYISLPVGMQWICSWQTILPVDKSIKPVHKRNLSLMFDRASFQSSIAGARGKAAG